MADSLRSKTDELTGKAATVSTYGFPRDGMSHAAKYILSRVISGGVSLIPAQLKASARKRLDDFAVRRVIEDFREHCSEPPQRRALLSYLVEPLLLPRRFRNQVMFSNRGIAQEIPRSLNELGFAVDIIDCRNASFVARKKYDLFIGHLGINFEKIVRHLGPDTAVIHFATGLEWQENNRRQEGRVAEVKQRRGYTIGTRLMEHSEECAMEMADAVICLSKRAAESFVGYRRVIPIDNAAYPVGWSALKGKDYRAGRSHFLFFAGIGNIMKGLDLVLEAFAGTVLDLYICQIIEPDFARAFAPELTQFDNIHLENFVKMRSARFEQLALKCDWIILPSCAEGHPGSVIECMAHGLLPIVTDGANIELPRGGIRIPRLDMEAVRSAAMLASQIDPEKIESAAKSLVRDARVNFSPENFRANFKHAVTQVFADRRKVLETSSPLNAEHG